MPFHDKKSKEKYEELLLNRYMSFAGWEVRMVKNCDRGLENGRGQHFQDRGHSFSPYRPTLSR